MTRNLTVLSEIIKNKIRLILTVFRKGVGGGLGGKSDFPLKLLETYELGPKTLFQTLFQNFISNFISNPFATLM